jgi:hypothetical protein
LIVNERKEKQMNMISIDELISRIGQIANLAFKDKDYKTALRGQEILLKYNMEARKQDPLDITLLSDQEILKMMDIVQTKLNIS